MSTGYPLTLTHEQRQECRRVLGQQHTALQIRQRALILLLADHRAGERTISNDLIASLADVDRRTVTRVRSSFARNGLSKAIKGAPRTTHTLRKLNNEQERRLLAIMKMPPPPGYPRWTVRTLAEAARDIEGMPTISRELVRRILKEQQGMAAFPVVDGADLP